jgi:hypothetical protein
MKNEDEKLVVPRALLEVAVAELRAKVSGWGINPGEKEADALAQLEEILGTPEKERWPYFKSSAFRMVVGFALLALSACGGIRTGLDFCHEVGRVECAKAESCEFPISSRERCEQDLTTACCNAPGMSCGAELEDDAVRAGLRCLDAVKAGSCAQFKSFVNGESRPLACD